MNFIFQNTTGEKIDVALREARYHFTEKDTKTGQLGFIRALGQNPYPRFHLYLTTPLATSSERDIKATLHLDQIKPRFEGTTAHNADYDSELVKNEAQRIKDYFQSQLQSHTQDKDF